METSLPVAAQVSPVETKRLKKIQRGAHVVSRISSIHSGHIELAIPLFKVSVVPIQRVCGSPLRVRDVTN